MISLGNLLANELGFGSESESTIETTGSKPVLILGIEEPVLDEMRETLPPLIEEQLTIFS